MSKQIERRIFDAPIEVRKADDGRVTVRGYAARYDSEAHGEVIRRGAFDRTIEQRDDIRLLVNHDGVPLARTKSGTLSVGTDDVGLWFEAALDTDGSQLARDLMSALERGDIDQCSFAGYFSDRSVDGLREVFEVRAVDVSIVTYPWYEETSVGLTGNRNVDRELIQIRSMPADERDLLVAALVVPDEVKSEPAPAEPEEQRDDRPRLSVAAARALLNPAA